MLHVVNGARSNWPDQLQAILLAQPSGAVLLQHCDHMPSHSTLVSTLQELYPTTQPITLLAADLSLVNHVTCLADWEPQVSQESFVHLYISPLQGSHLQRLIAVVAQLRSPTGCPWDRAQTPQSLTPYILEEAYETVAAIRSEDPDAIAEELGDLLLQVVLQAQIFSETQTFDLDEVANRIATKLIRRHPHVFGPEAGESVSIPEVHRNWEAIKQAEQPDQTLGQKLYHYAEILPPLMAALKISRKVVQLGFDWPTVGGIWAKLAEEEAELQQELNQPLEGLTPEAADHLQRRRAAELGDVLFTLVNLGRWYDLDPATALQETNRRFAQRWQQMETLLQARSAGPRDQSDPIAPDASPDSRQAAFDQRPLQLQDCSIDSRQAAFDQRPLQLQDCSMDELEALWQEAKHVHP